MPTLTFPASQLFATWADHLFADPARVARAAGFVAPEQWVVIECASATERTFPRLGLEGWRILVDRHPPSLAPGLKADMALLPPSPSYAEAERDGAFFEFKVAWAECSKTLTETIASVAHDVRTRRPLPQVYSAVLAFAYEWGDILVPANFRWPPRRDRDQWPRPIDHLRAELAALQLEPVTEREVTIPASGEAPSPEAGLWFGLYRHPRS